jgi:hypothetical protein
MATTRFFHDTRRAKPGVPSIMKIAICHDWKRALVSTDVKLLPNQWDDAKSKVVNHPDKLLVTTYLGKVRANVDSIILHLTNEGVINNMTASEIKDVVVSELNPDAKKQKENKYSFIYRFTKYMERTKPGCI